MNVNRFIFIHRHGTLTWLLTGRIGGSSPLSAMPVYPVRRFGCPSLGGPNKQRFPKWIRPGDRYQKAAPGNRAAFSAFGGAV